MNAPIRMTSRAHGSAHLVEIIGEIDLSNARDLLDAIVTAVPNEADSVVVDLSGVTYLDSAGIATIFRLAERLTYRRQQLRLVVPTTSPVRRVLELTGADRVIELRDALDGLAADAVTADRDRQRDRPRDRQRDLESPDTNA